MQPAILLRSLALPLRTAPLLLIAVFSVLLILAMKASLLGIPLGLLLLTGFFNYAFILVDGIADGAQEPPVLSIEMMNPVSGQRALMVLVIVIIVFFASSAATYWLGAWFATVCALVVAATLPAIVAVQAATGSALQALNLRTCLRLIARLGGDYALIVALVAFATVVSTYVASKDLLPRIALVALFMYFWLAVFALIGTVLFARRADLGMDDALEPEVDAVESDRELERAHDRLIDRIYAQWRGGAQGNAWKTVSAQFEQSADPLAELRWLYARIAQWPDPRLANRLARELLPRLLAMRHNGEALDMVRARLRTDGDFRPQTSNDLLSLIRLARDAGDRPTARALLRDFERFYPQDAGQPAAALLTRQLER